MSITKIQSQQADTFFRSLNKCKLILLDIDGTLTIGSQPVSPTVSRLINKIKSKITISLVSSRSRRSGYEIVKQLGLESHHIFENGAVIVDPSFQPVYVSFLQEEKLSTLYKFLHNRFSFNICVHGITSYYRQKIVKNLKKMPYSGITRISILELSEKDSIILAEELRKRFPFSLNRAVDKSNPKKWNIDLTAVSTNKESASRTLHQILKVSYNQTIGVGDGYSDISFIKNVSVKVAMGNAVDELKKIADLTLPAVDKDGLAVLLRLIDKNI